MHSSAAIDHDAIRLPTGTNDEPYSYLKRHPKPRKLLLKPRMLKSTGYSWFAHHPDSTPAKPRERHMNKKGAAPTVPPQAEIGITAPSASATPPRQ